jgi:proteasome lid subunit RPN8/RPN11
MNWREQPADIQPPLISDLLRTVSALDAVCLLARTRKAPTVYLTPECREGIWTHLHSHRTEMGGLLIGLAYVAGTSLPETWGPLVSIERFLPSETFRSSGVSLAMGTEIWDRARSVTAHDDGMVVGWYHSHPNLGAFFSSTDRATQRAFFNQAYSVGLVVDPIRGEEAWFIGADSASLRSESVLITGPTLPCGDPPQRSSKDGQQ